MKYRPLDFGSSNRRPIQARWPLAGWLLFYALLLLGVLLTASFVGELRLSPASVWHSWRGVGQGRTFEIWYDYRFTRLLFAGAVGGVLALCGTVYQASLRNPLAEPYILGISGAAAVGAASARLLGASVAVGAVDLERLTTGGAFLGAVLALLLLLGLARWARLYDPPSLILAGAVLNAIFGALILLIFSLSQQGHVMESLLWLMGNTDAAVTYGTHNLRNALLVLATGGVLFLAVARHLDLLSLGDEEAADLGLSPVRFRVAALLVASILTALVVAVAGPIGFIGLIVPHALRRLHGPSHRRLIPLSLLGGAIFLMLADTVSRSTPRLLPIGAVTALVGGPFFLILLGARTRARGAAA